VRAGGATFHFEIGEEIKHRLLNGLDDIALTLQQAAEVDAFERDRERAGPVTTAL
jgi:3-isopropylmalate/(R)-2-methylmalate dehydratase small subunit